MERRGLPTAVMITDEFRPTALKMLENQGADWYPFVEVEHPINIRNDEELRAMAEASVEEVVRLLTGN
ncbi:MAG: hypothetical protein QGG58_08255 [Chloroflexota bacterium]|nr:hypothetical protein [Chloroflexota bacterium]